MEIRTSSAGADAKYSLARDSVETRKNPSIRERISRGFCRSYWTASDYDAIFVPTVVNVVLALVPKVVIAPMQTTMIRASITAYSTAVGPSSDFRKR